MDIIYTDGSYYMHTDAGYMRSMLYFGLIGMGWYYFSILSMLYGIYVNLKKTGFSLAIALSGSLLTILAVF